MAGYLSQLGQIWDFLITCLTGIFSVYTAAPILMSVLTLWVLDRVFHIFNFLRG